MTSRRAWALMAGILSWSGFVYWTYSGPGRIYPVSWQFWAVVAVIAFIVGLVAGRRRALGAALTVNCVAWLALSAWSLTSAGDKWGVEALIALIGLLPAAATGAFAGWLAGLVHGWADRARRHGGNLAKN